MIINVTWRSPTIPLPSNCELLQQQQQQLLVRSRLRGVWGDPKVGSLTLVRLLLTKRPISLLVYSININMFLTRFSFLSLKFTFNVLIYGATQFI